MRLAYTRLVTDDVSALARFYEALTGVSPNAMDDYVEFHVEGAWLAICTRRAAEFMHGGTWSSASNRSAIIEFEVEDPDAEYQRLQSLVTDWVQPPKSMPWGSRSTIFRDPDGNAVNLFAPVTG